MVVTAEHAAGVVDVRCPICGERAVEHVLVGRDEYFGLPGQFTLVRCGRCDLVYISPRPPFERILEHYPSSYYSFQARVQLPSVATRPNALQRVFLAEQGYGSNRPGPLARAVTRAYGLIRPEQFRVAFRPVPRWRSGGRLLDVGCGAGIYLSEMRKLGWTVEGVDISEQACAAAFEEFGIRPYCGAVQDAPFAEACFDVVTIWETLEHVPDPLPTLRRCLALLVPGGRLLGAVPNYRSLYRFWFGPAYLHLDLPRHLFHYSIDSLARVLRAAGFADVSIRSRSGGGDTLLVSREMQRNRRNGRQGVRTDFWEGQSSRLRATTWALKPLHLAIDLLGLGVRLEFEARRP